MIEAVIFDWAGTTVDYGSFAPVKGFIDAFAKYGVAITSAEARAPMGLLKIDHTRAIANTPRVKEEFIRKNGHEATEEEIRAIYEDFEKTLMANIGDHVEVKDHVIDTVAELRRRGIRIGSTTGYTSKMMETILPLAAANGYSPDYTAAPDGVPKGRPFPYMIWKNMTELAVGNTRHVIKIGDTEADIKEGLNANCWSVAVIMGSNEMGLTREEAIALSPEQLEVRKRCARKVFYEAGADYIINDMDELVGLVDEINLRMERDRQYKLMTPGPLTTKTSVKNAMMTDHCTWADEYKQIATSVCTDIANISADENYATVLIQGSGSYAVESMINSLCAKDEKILFLVNGEYGKRMVKISEMAEKNYDAIMSDPCLPVDVKALEERLKADADIRTVAFAHCETTTGVLNPLNEIVNIAKHYGKAVLVDAMSSFAAYDIDMPGLGIDALAASSNKCLEGLPGLSFIIVKKSILDSGKTHANSHCLDMFDQYEGLYAGGGKFRFTSPTNILLALEQAIKEYKKEGGLSARADRYKDNHAILTQGLAEVGIKAIVKQEDQSYIITTFELGNRDFKNLYNAIKDKGFVIYPGKLTDAPTFRLGNIGDVYPSDMVRLVEAVRGAIHTSI